MSLGVSTSDESGVVGRVEVVERFRSEVRGIRDVRLGEGGYGAGGLL